MRRIHGALRPLLKAAPLSKSGLPRIVAPLKAALEAWQTRSLADLDAVYLYLDAIALRVRSAGMIVAPNGEARYVIQPDLSRTRAHARVMEPEGSLPFFHMTRDSTYRERHTATWHGQPLHAGRHERPPTSLPPA